MGSIVTQLAAIYNNMLGTRFKIIYGYPSGPEMTLAMERGEVEGRSTSNPQVLGASKAEVAAKYNFLIQVGMRKIPNYEEVPLLRELASNPEQQAIFDFLSKAVVIARPIVTNARRAAGTGRGVAPRLRRDAGRSGLPGRRRTAKS